MQQFIGFNVLYNSNKWLSYVYICLSVVMNCIILILCKHIYCIFNLLKLRQVHIKFHGIIICKTYNKVFNQKKPVFVILSHCNWGRKCKNIYPDDVKHDTFWDDNPTTKISCCFSHGMDLIKPDANSKALTVFTTVKACIFTV